MANIVIRRGWQIPERLATAEAAFLNRRHFLRQIGLASGGLLGAPLISGRRARAASLDSTNAVKPGGGVPRTYPAPRNPEFNPNWTVTNERVAGRYNNFYEFT